MRRLSAALSSLILVLAFGLTAGGDDDAPPLTAPLDVPVPAPEPAAKPAEPKAEPPPRPLLVVPGLARPKRAVAPVVAPTIPRLEPIDDVDAPPVIESPAPRPEHRTTASAADSTPGLSLETVPPEELEGRTLPGTTPGTRRGDPDEPSKPSAGTPPPRRRFFGGRLAPPAASTGRSPRERDPIRVEQRSDPAADAALKRRVERTIRESLGERVRSVDVLVVDREITIRARADRFWNRRAVRRQLENLPGLGGYRARVELLD